MNITRRVSIFPLLFLALSCSYSKQVYDDDLIGQTISEHAAKQKRRYQLELAASGNSCLNEIQAFALHYNTNQKLQIPGVRKLFVLSVEEFLNMVNAKESLRPLLKQHPMTVEHLQYNIGFVNIEGEFYEPPYVAYAYLADDKICYCYYDNLFGTFIDYEDVEEPYLDALQIVMGERQPMGSVREVSK